MKVSRLIVEKVVRPPQKPAMTKLRPTRSIIRRPSGRVSVAKNMMIQEPTTLTKAVAKSSLSPSAETIRKPDRKRASEPIAVPQPTAR